MKYSPNELIMALKRVYELFGLSALNIGQYRDLRDCVQIAYENGAWRNNPEVIYKTVDDPRRVYRNSADPERVYKNQGDPLADIDAGVDDVFDKFDKEDDE